MVAASSAIKQMLNYIFKLNLFNSHRKYHGLKPLPSHLEFRAQVTKDESKFYVIDFEPVELMEAFEKLGANGERVFIEFDPQIPVTNMKIRIYNDTKPKNEKTPKEYIELKKFKVDP